MSTRGRKPKPAALKVAEGNPGKRPINRAEPKPGALGDPPKDMPDVAVAKWRELASDDAWGQMLTAADRDVLEIYCRTYAHKVAAEAELATSRLLVKAQNGFPVENPYLSVILKCQRELLRLAAEFGGTPSGRTRLHANPTPPGKNKFDKFRKSTT